MHKKNQINRWHLYILRCSDGTLYTGVTTDVKRRLEEHNTSKVKGSNYTRARLPVKLVYQEPHSTRSRALKREAQIKKMTRREKDTLIKS